MINAEKYKDELLKVINDNVQDFIAFDTRDNKIKKCPTIKCDNCKFSGKKSGVLCTQTKLKWLLSEYKEPIKVSKFEYDILKYLSDNTSNMYITRTKVGNIYLHKSKPKKDKVNALWAGEYPTSLIPFNKLFQFVQWEDEKPYSINDILKNCRVIDDNIVIHKIVDE